MFAVAVDAHGLAIRLGKELLVGFGIDLVPGMALEAKGVDRILGEHPFWRGAVASRSPGFVRDMRVGFTMALGASDVGLGVDFRQFFLHEIDVADLAAAVIGPPHSLFFRRPIIEQQGSLGFRRRLLRIRKDLAWVRRIGRGRDCWFDFGFRQGRRMLMSRLASGAES